MHYHYGQPFRKSESHADCKFRTRPLGCHHLGQGNWLLLFVVPKGLLSCADHSGGGLTPVEAGRNSMTRFQSTGRSSLPLSERSPCAGPEGAIPPALPVESLAIHQGKSPSATAFGSGHSRPRHFCGTAGETAARLSAGHLWTNCRAPNVPEISDAVDRAERPALADHGEALARHYVTQLAASASVSNHSPLNVQPDRTFRLAVRKLVQSVQPAAGVQGERNEHTKLVESFVEFSAVAP
jgi:hypothetical protein